MWGPVFRGGEWGIYLGQIKKKNYFVIMQFLSKILRLANGGIYININVV